MTWPPGILSAGVACGIKRGGVPDLGVIVGDDAMSWAGTFTKNAAAAASVVWSRALLGNQVHALVVNSGNANACTGTQGVAAVEETADEAARIVGCDTEQVLIASTGPIGIQLPVDLVIEGLPRAVAELSEDSGAFARSILTTDTVIKTSSVRVGNASIVGVAKGAAMLAPNMATMLAFVSTDAALAGPLLQDSLDEAVGRSFDCICVDACESTNDSVFLLATGAAGPIEQDLFAKGLQEVCSDLAEQIVRDAEGATRFLRARISGATDDHTARSLGRAIAGSALWRAAVHGSDPNWGRVLAALGAADRTLDLKQVELRIGPEIVYSQGEPTDSLEEAARVMAQGDIVLACEVGDGPGRAEVLTTDLSPDYVNLNAHGGLVMGTLSEAEPKARTLVEALPYIRSYRGQTVVTKIGGAALDDPTLAGVVAEDLALLTLVGIRLVIVHGGGPQVSEAMRAAGIEPEFIGGLRVTDEASMEVVSRVLIGSINSDLVRRLCGAGLRAVGLSGVDAGLIEATVTSGSSGEDLGRVGRVAVVRPELLGSLLAEDYTPVIASVGVGEDGGTLNVNADAVAGAVAGALRAAKLVYLTNVEGLYGDLGDSGSLISELKRDELASMASGLSSGMRPKAESSVAALDAGVGKVHILDGRTPHALLLEIFTDEGIGTQVLP